MNRLEDMNCERVESLLPAFVGGDLSADETAAVTAHLDSCAQCSESLAAFASLEQTLVARRDDVPPLDAFLRGVYALRDPARARRGWVVRSFRVMTSVPGVAIILVVWAALLIAQYNDRLAGDIAQKTSLDRMTAVAKRGLDFMVAAAGGDAWTLTAVYGALAIAVIVSAGALTVRFVRS